MFIANCGVARSLAETSRRTWLECFLLQMRLVRSEVIRHAVICGQGESPHLLVS